MSSADAPTLPAIPDPDASQVSAIAGLPENLAVLRLQTDHCTALAAAKPRNLVTIVKGLKEQLEQFPTFAAKAVYNKPVGREANRCGKCNAEFKNHKHRRCGNCEAINVEVFDGHELREGQVELKLGPMKYATGLSIHAAESIAEAYLYNAIETYAESKDLEYATVTVTFMDFQAGRMRRAQRDVPKYMTYRDGKQSKIDENRFWEVVIPAATSRLLREVILRMIPASVKEELLAAAQAAQEEALTQDKVNEILQVFSGWGVSQRQIEVFVGKPVEKWTSADRGKLGGVWQAINDGDTTVAEMFNMLDEEPFSGEGRGEGQTTERMLTDIAEQEFDSVAPRDRAGAIEAAIQSMDPGGLALSPEEAVGRLRQHLTRLAGSETTVEATEVAGSEQKPKKEGATRKQPAGEVEDTGEEDAPTLPTIDAPPEGEEDGGDSEDEEAAASEGGGGMKF
jgi:hypothetical protein